MTSTSQLATVPNAWAVVPTAACYGRLGELAGEAADLGGGDAARAGDPLGRERLGQRLDILQPGEVLGEPTGIDQILREQRVDHPEQQERVGSGTDEVVLVGLGRGPGAAGVDHDDLSAPRADPPQAPAHVGRGEQAAVRHQRVGAQDQQVVGAIHVGHRNGEHGAEHVAGGDLLGHLVERARREDVLGAEGADEPGEVDEHAQAVRRGVAEIQRGGVATVLLEDRLQPGVDLGERLVPGRLAQLAVAPDHRRAEAIRILVELLEPVRLGTEEAAAEHVVGIAADRDHLGAAGGDLQTARRLAERAGAEARPHIGVGAHRRPPSVAVRRASHRKLERTIGAA
jgi:hypothetical protein